MCRAELAVHVTDFVHDIRKKDPAIGGNKLWHMYNRSYGSTVPIGRDRFRDILDEYGLKIRRRIRAPRTTDSRHGLPTYPNLIRSFIPCAINQLWVSDITYIPIWTSDDAYVFCYLSLILDAYDEEVIGWSVGSTLGTEYPMQALRMALKRIGTSGTGLIHHSDRGCQYASREYTSVLIKRGIRISMTESGDPKENAQAERINNTIKNELLKGMTFHSIDEVRAAVADAVDFYNNERPHMSIGMKTPTEASNCTGELSKLWKSYRELAIKDASTDEQISEKSLPLSSCHGSPLEHCSSVNP